MFRLALCGYGPIDFGAESEKKCLESSDKWTASSSYVVKAIEWANKRDITMFSGKEAFKKATQMGGPYEYMKAVGISPHKMDNVVFGLAIVFRTSEHPKSMTTYPATWNSINDPEKIPNALGDAVGLHAAFGYTFIDTWKRIIQALDDKCNLFQAVCPCPAPEGADFANHWCTSKPCQSLGEAPLGFNPEKEFLAKTNNGIFPPLEAPPIEPDTASLYDMIAGEDYIRQYGLTDRVGLLQQLNLLSKEADLSDTSFNCGQARSRYRLFWKMAAGANHMFSGLAENVGIFGKEATSFGYTGSERGISEYLGSNGRLVKDFGAAILTWPEDGLAHDRETHST
eukprot:gnl/TRDRNA2_/TRDRNA2_130713_c0_seq1.p1 gnl/TRDRNA2_/TRDRNA2_130713_c0~~gnl/TRDRNA2_/TRDRNA2_130713_c0_seq1.p1  ORF type:complete len:340 (+),score=49.19 gnl/TRDRNA2_/TRDRNA2_130713_c0_seq1:617-1636(+)